MVLTVLEAEVSPRQWNELKAAYQELVKNSVPGQTPVQSLLLQSDEDVNVWRLMGVWNTRDDFDAVRKAGTPRGVLMFRKLGVEPAMSLFEVVATTMIADAIPASQH
ncbi:MAG TPA: hypothetical protein VGL38_00720 [bacterium]|jgi:quinol monooxygenase YgiN